MAKDSVLIISTGGTITMTGGGGSSAIAPTLSADDLLAAVPQLKQLADIETLTFSTVPGASLRFGRLFELAALITQKLAGEFTGAIVIQGTDTIEETAFLLGLLIDSEKPVIVTGAMRGAAAAGADGPANLLASVAVAVAPGAKGRGVLVVLNDEIHSAVFVKKGHTALPSSFISPSSGPVGLVAEQQVLFTSSPDRPRVTLAIPPAMQAVAVVKATLSDDGRLLGALESLGYAGLVVEAMGAGHVPEYWAPLLGQLAERMPVVLAVRTPGGPVFSHTYGFPGSETDLLGRGLVRAGMLDALKARLLLGTLISNRQAMGDIRRCFAAFNA